MKEWNNPELFSLGIDMTMEDRDPKVHAGYCHAIGGACTGKENEHSAMGSSADKDHYWTGNACKEHYVLTGNPSNNGNYACCCSTNLIEAS